MPQISKRILYLFPFFLMLAYFAYGKIISISNAGLLFLAVLLPLLIALKSLHRSRPGTPLAGDDTQSLFINIMENLNDPFLLLNQKEVILLANKSAKKMFGYNIIDQKISDYLYDVEALLAINKAIESGKSDTVEFTSGSPLPRSYLLRIYVVEKTSNYGNSEDLNIPQDERTIFLTIYDITSIREAERMRVDFVANVSHELRTPLASILGFIETLQGAAKNDAVAIDRFLKIMQDEASRMARLIEDLLSLSQIERNAHIPPDHNISLKKIIENVIETMDMRLIEKSMAVKFTTEYKTGNINGDRDQLTQVFQNLLDNAIKYGDEGTSISIEMNSYLNKVEDKKFMEITITNKGAGIAPEHIERLTERFYRVDTARSRSLGGTGLGLAIVKHILQRHEGKLFFESEVGKYTAATVLLPMKA